MSEGILPMLGKIVYLRDSEPTVEYRPVVGFPNYAVGNDGIIWSLNRGRITEVKPSMRGAKRQYWGVTLQCRGKRRATYFHVVVLEAFCGPCPSGCQSRHLDGDPNNNRRDNLKWGTPLEQSEDKRKHGTMNYGSRNGMTSLTDSDVVSIKDRLAGGDAPVDIAADSKVSLATVCRIASAKVWARTDARLIKVVKRLHRGSANQNAKLTQEQVESIFHRGTAGECRSKLAREFGVSPGLIGHILHDRAWKHVTRKLMLKMEPIDETRPVQCSQVPAPS